MEKRKDIAGYILYHSDVEYGIWDNSLYTPQSVFDSELGYLNSLYCELSGTYAIWKKHPRDVKYILHCQYRRRLYFPEDYDFDQDFAEHDIITVYPAVATESASNLRTQYELCHNIEDYNIMEKILKEMYPEYSELWDRYVNNGKYIFYSNVFVMKTEDFDKYCEWLFSLFDRFRNVVGLNTIDDVKEHLFQAALSGNFTKNIKTTLNYQCRIFGYLAERLFTAYLFKNFKNPKLMLYSKMEEGMNL